jgi:hypothetical protein
MSGSGGFSVRPTEKTIVAYFDAGRLLLGFLFGSLCSSVLAFTSLPPAYGGLYAVTFIKYISVLFGIIVMLVTGTLLIRTLFGEAVAIWAEGDKICWRRLFGFNFAEFADIESLEPFTASTLMLRLKSGRKRYIPTGFTTARWSEVANIIAARSDAQLNVRSAEKR